MQFVRVTIQDNIATLVLDRAEARNAINPQLLADLKQAFSDIHQEKRVKAAVLTAAGEHFCSGVDLKVFAGIADMEEQEAVVQWFELWRDLTELYEQMLQFPKPVVAAVDGLAIGAGLALVLAADVFIMSDRARLSADAVGRGLVGGATAALLSFRFGGSIAARMLLTGEEMDATTAARLGYAAQVVSSEQVWIAASKWAADCGKAPHEALQATKRVLNERIGESLMTQMASGAADSATACTTPTAVEGIRAFVEGREADW